MIRLGIVGFGYWGPNIARNFSQTDDVKVTLICDSDDGALIRARKAYPDVAVTRDPHELIQSPQVDCVAVVTPVSLHYPLAKEALLAGKHVFVEKPFTATVAEAEELVDLGSRRRLTVMVDHTFIFTGAVRKIRELCLEQRQLGDVLYYDSTRVNLGLFQRDVNVIWDLAPHDFTIMDYVTEQRAVALSATGFDHFNTGFENVAFVTVYFDRMIAHFNVNWLSPVKVRRTLIGGTKKMLVWDDNEADEKIRVYDKGVNVTLGEVNSNDLRVSYRSGDATIPRVDHTEALRLEAKYFAECVSTGKTPINDGEAGLRVVRFLVSANESLRQRGKEIRL